LLVFASRKQVVEERRRARRRREELEILDALLVY
jgi:hypothetical protein